MASHANFEKSSGNVFADLNLPDAEEARTKADLAHLVASLIKKKKFTHTQAAKLLGINQPEFASLLRGKLTNTPTEHLFRFLNALGCDVEIVIRPTRRSLASVRVVAP